MSESRDTCVLLPGKCRPGFREGEWRVETEDRKKEQVYEERAAEMEGRKTWIFERTRGNTKRLNREV